MVIIVAKVVSKDNSTILAPRRLDMAPEWFQVIAVMQLSQYLDRQGLSVQEFAQRVGVERQSVRRWVNGERIPHWRLIRKIQEVTNCSVNIDDFYDSKFAYSKINVRRNKARKSA